MAVFTEVSEAEAQAFLDPLQVGRLQALRGISAGIENTNYFVTTEQGHCVLTLFEKLTVEQLPFYLELMAHLANHGLPCPRPVANLDNGFLGQLNGRPAALVTRLPGRPVMTPDAHHCGRVGEVLADLHLAGRSYPGHLDNLRGNPWWEATVPLLLPFLDDDNRRMLLDEVAFQASLPRARLPRGVVHADLFRDNVLFDGDAIGGVIDFYFACVDALLYDVAITVNDWCMNERQVLDPVRCRALLEAYHATRPFTDEERALWPAMLRAGALRFWVSRLHDYHLPRPGELTHAHDPGQFERILRNHVAAYGRPDASIPLP